MSEPNEPQATQSVPWERQVLEKVALAAIQEQRKTRHWGILFKSLTFIYLFIVLFLVADWFEGAESTLAAGKHTALIDIQGVIAAEEVNADQVILSLQDAFEDKKTQGVVVRINSPGGSPVQAGAINDEMRRQRKLHPDIPLYVVVDDICASGGYYIAAAADKIFVDKASIVGSIGVLMDGFGFTGTMQKMGVERRLLHAGENKGFLDPFSPQDARQTAHAQNMLDEIHQQFIDTVKQGRGARLKPHPDIFSGLVWSGAKSIELGLADGLGSLEFVAREVIRAEDIVDYTPQDDFAERFAKRFGAAMARVLGDTGHRLR